MENVNVPAGYKQTELGVLPEGWEVKELGAIGTIIRGASPRPKGDPRYYGGDVPRLMVEDVTRDGKVVYPKIDYLTKAGAKLSRPCKKGTLTIVCSGTVGVVSFLGVDACIHDGFLAIININRSVSSNYLYYQLSRLRDTFDASATHGGVFTNLTTSGVKDFNVPLPPLPEQQAIADALGEVDALLAAQRARLAKQRAVKQGLLQTLLSGQQRLPGFAGEWEVKRLGDVADIDVDNLTARTPANYEFDYVSLEDVSLGTLLGSTRYKFSESPSRARRKVQKDDVLVATVRPNLKSHLFINKEVKDLVCSTGFAVIRCYSKIAHPRFIYSHFFADAINQQIDTLIGGSNYPAISSRDIKNMLIDLPPLDEQRAIAAVLSEADAALEALEAEHAKTQLLKQGLMQNLLTGKLRLPL